MCGFMSIFKAYDIRGIFPSEINEDIVYRTGRALVNFLGCENVVVGQDMRESSKSLFHALTNGITEQGANVIDIGLCTTPMSYFANGELGADASIMITASHNPGNYNGLKLCRKGAVPISGDTGIQEISRLVNDDKFKKTNSKGKIIRNEEIKGRYIEHIRSFLKQRTDFRIVVDCANAMGVLEMEVLQGTAKIIPLFDTLDSSFPNHEANPLKTETLQALQDKVVSEKAELGVAFDGDADRVGFVDENGQVIPMDLVTALIAKDILSKGPRAIMYDLRSSRIVREVIEENNGIAIECRVGHAFIKQMMRENNVFFAGELSGHYYFKDNYTTESSSLAVIYLLNLMTKTGKKISELVAPLKKYHQSGEINSTVSDPQKILAKLEKKYSDGIVSHLDGLKITYPDWWLNVRPSNTEPLLRLNVEADTQETMEEKRDEVLGVIRGL